MDVAALLCTSLSSENIDNWSHELLKTYLNRFQMICSEFEIDVPFDYEEIKNFVFDNGIFLIMLDNFLTTYEKTVRSNSHFKKRFMWQLKTCLKFLTQNSQELQE